MRGIAIWQMLYDSYDVYLMINLKHYNFIEVYLNKNKNQFLYI